MTTEAKRIEDQLQRAVEGSAWHGPALFELLEGLTPDKAATARGGTHTIWEILSHISAWLSAARRRIEGEEVSLTHAEDWPAAGTTDEKAWTELRGRLEREYQQLLATLRALPDSALARKVPGKDYSVYFLLHGVIQHTLYHAGQIALARKVLR